jgi:hypothetical protein
MELNPPFLEVELGDLALYIEFLMEELSYPFEEMYLDLLGFDEVLDKIGGSWGGVAAVS